MAIHLDVRHPSPVSALPRRGRRERHGFEALITPVAIPEVAPGAFRPLPPIEMGQVALYGIHVHEGATWSELEPPSGGRRFTAGDVLGFARDGTHPDADLLSELRAALRFTPLHAGALAITGSHTEGTDMSLGDPLSHLDDRALGRVTRQERERSAANLRSWIPANLAVTGDKVMIRTPVMLHVMEWHGHLNVYSTVRMGLGPYGICGIRPDAARAYCASLDKPFDDEAMEEGLGLFEAWAADLSTDDDIRMLAERMPALVQAIAEDAARSPGYKKRVHSPEMAAQALEDLMPWRLRGACGGIGPDEVGPALRDSVAAVETLRQAGVPIPGGLSSKQGILDVVAEHYLPRADAIAPEDVQALSLVA